MNIFEPEKLVGKKIAYKTLSTISHGKVTSAGLLPDVVRVEIRGVAGFAIVEVADILKVYDDDRREN